MPALARGASRRGCGSARDDAVTAACRSSRKNATLRQILAEWARVGQTKIVNAERVPGGPMTLELTNVPEVEALEILLRSAGGYVLAPRACAHAKRLTLRSHSGPAAERRPSVARGRPPPPAQPRPFAPAAAGPDRSSQPPAATTMTMIRRNGRRAAPGRSKCRAAGFQHVPAGRAAAHRASGAGRADQPSVTAPVGVVGSWHGRPGAAAGRPARRAPRRRNSASRIARISDVLLLTT